jgi:predicted 2-oxoglutarate/Fe(II)-dependent dioxygenase YbiX
MKKHQLSKNNYLYIPNFIKSKRAKKLAKEFIKFAKDNDLQGDHQAVNSQTSYNYIDFLELLCEKTPEVSEFIGETVLPTYTYARVYKEGSVLEKHTDRDACEISLTLHLNGDTSWPIWVEKPNGESVSINLKSGDAMLYLGCDAPHWREQFKGKEYVQVFLHYVRSRGDRSHAYFDKKDGPVPKKQELVAETTKHNPVHSKDLKDYIMVFESIVPDDLCDIILKEYQNGNDWTTAQVGPGVVDTRVRDVDWIGISLNEVIAVNPTVRQTIDQRLYECAGNAIKLYNQKFPLAEIEEDSGYELLRYQKNQKYIQHTDSFKLRPRAVSCSFMLNDNYEGGEFSFFSREMTYKIPKGSVIMFPSNFMYPHEILPVTEGIRYSIITWFI